MSDRRIAISAVGGMFPSAPNVPALWDFVAAGRSAMREPPPGRWSIPLDEAYQAGPPAADKVYSRRGCFIESPLKPSRSPAGLDLKSLDEMVKLAVAAAEQTLAGLPLDDWRPERVGICIGNIALPTVGASEWSRRVLLPRIAARVGMPTPRLPEAHPLNRYVTGLPAGVIAKTFGFSGGVRTVDAACASSLYAIKLAIDDLLDGRIDAMLAGGMARPDPLYTQMGFCQLHALSPSGVCRPFDAAADGLVVGEGACFFLLERLNDAARRRRNILGVIHGVALSNDVGGNILAPDSEGQLRALTAAYKQAGWSPSDVEVIECHATGTPMGDRVELASLAALRMGIGARAVLGSVKSNVGHLLTGAGAAGLAKVLGQFARAQCFPMANFTNLAPSQKDVPFEILSHARDWPAPKNGAPRRAAVSAFGFGGINAHLLVEEWRNQSSSLSIASPGVPPPPLSVSVVGIGVRVGEWQGKESFARRAIFGEGPALSDCTLECREFDVPAGRFPIPPKEFADLLPQQTLMLQAVDEAWREIGADSLSPDARKRVGGCFGISLDLNTTNFDLRWSMSGAVPAAQLSAARANVSPPLNADRTLGALGGVVASRIARVYKLGGPNFTLSCEEASGLAALDAAARALDRGDVDLAIVGAVDLPTDPRVVASDLELNNESDIPFADAAVSLILKRTIDAERDGDFQYAVLRGVAGASSEAAALRNAAAESRSAINHALSADPTPLVGRTGAASGLVALAQGCLGIAARVHPATDLGAAPLPWLRNRADGPRLLTTASSSVDGSSWAAVLEQSAAAHPSPSWLAPTDEVDELLLTFRAPSRHDLASLVRQAAANAPPKQRAFASFGDDISTVQLALVVARSESTQQLTNLAASLENGSDLGDGAYLVERDSPQRGDLAFVFPGSGAQLPGMGRDWALAFPDVVEQLDRENNHLADQFAPDAFWRDSGRLDEPLAVIQGQVSFGLLLTRILAHYGVKPDATLGYSLGESTALFAVGAWRERDEMHRRLRASPLFQSQLAGTCEAARRHWGLDENATIDWLTAVVNRPKAQVLEALDGVDRAYLQFVNTPRQCVLGGDRAAVMEVVAKLRAPFAEVRGASTVHCPVAQEVRDDYLTLHQMPTVAPDGVRCYSAAWGEGFVPDEQSAAETITALSTHTVDFPCVVDRAYEDGVRVFLDVGPGSSCSRMIDAILAGRPHRCIPLGVKDRSPSSSLKRALAALWAEGFEPNLDRLNKELSPPSPPAQNTMHVLYPKPVWFDHAQEAMTLNASSTDESLVPTPNTAPVREFSPPTIPLHQPSPMVHPMALAENSDALIAQWTSTQESVAAAHSTFLTLQTATTDQWRRLLGQLLDAPQSPPASNREIVLEAPLPPPRNEPPATVVCRLEPPRALSRDECIQFAIGSIGAVLGERYAEIDAFPTRVRLPDEPLMLVDRIVKIEGEPLSMQPGRVVTEHDIHPGAWYLDAGRIPTCIAVESGQADLFLSGFLGIDFITRGLAMYRLLDAAVAFHAPLPGPGATIRYDIRIERFFEHAGAHFFRFIFDATVDGRMLLTMRDGCAGFFTQEALDAGRGVVRTAIDAQPRPGKTPADWQPLVDLGAGSMSESEVDALRAGDLSAAFGSTFANLPINRPATIPGGRMRLVHRVPHVDPKGGRYGLGVIRGEADVHPDDWFLTCHFVDDRVMPGTLMYECCLHTLRVLLLRMGWVAPEGEVVFEPVPEVSSRLKCRGQVIESTKKTWYEVEIKEIGFNPAPYVIADALMYADGKPIVEMTDMSLQLSGQTRASLESVWSQHSPPPQPLYDRRSILEFAVGKPSLAFGDRYLPFDAERFIARLPGPPYQCIDRIVEVSGEPWIMKAGAGCIAEYDVPPDEWYFDDNGGGPMPFAVLLEIALQPCGWLAAYVGSALTSDGDLHFRNLGGRATQHAVVGRDAGTLNTRVKITAASSSGGMIIQHYDFEVRAAGKPVYTGNTYFGFFSNAALANQVGIRDSSTYAPSSAQLAHAKSFAFPSSPPHPSGRLRMMDDVSCFVPRGGAHGLGFIEGRKTVNPDEWFFKAHFHQDPVWPGSLGVEAMLQLLGVMAADRWGRPASFQATALGLEHQWIYRGQVLPTANEVIVQATATNIDEDRRVLTADGVLSVDGKAIYQMSSFTIAWNPQ